MVDIKFESKKAEQEYQKIIQKSVYAYLKMAYEKFPEYTALKYYGIKTTYSALMQKIDEAERALRAFGLKKGDVAVVALPAIPEAVHLFYAINKIGAIFCGLDCRSKEDEIFETVRAAEPKVFFVSDFQLQAFRNIKYTKVIYVRATNSIGGFTRFTGFFADLFRGRLYMRAKKKNIVCYQNFLKATEERKSEAEEVNGDDICAYFYTSGTTYGRKCVVLTNSNINAAVYQHGNGPNEIKAGERMLNIMPLFTCYGITLGTHLPLCFGVEVCLVPLFRKNRLKQILLKNKPNFVITVPSHWDAFSKQRSVNYDLGFLKTVVVGGDKLNPHFEEKVNEIFKKSGSSAWLINGYGLTETASTALVPDGCTPKGSMGKMLAKTEVGIFEEQSDRALPHGEVGEICICGPSVCKGYLGDKETTERLLKLHSDGRIWLHSGDRGYMDSNGYFYFCERIKRMFVRFDGTKVSPYSIEQAILNCPYAESCLVVAVEDDRYSHGKCAIAFIVVNNRGEKVNGEAIIRRFIYENLPEHMIPKEIHFVSDLPITPNGKLDYFMKL